MNLVKINNPVNMNHINQYWWNKDKDDNPHYIYEQ